MLTQTHRFIGKLIYDKVKENLNVELHEESFKNGNIMPDFHPRLISICHYKNQSFDFVLGLIEELEKQSFPKDKKSLKTFSINLGIISHYMADYFCFAHNDTKLDKMPQHLFYEFSIANMMVKIQKNTIYFLALEKLKKIDMYCFEWHKDYINDKHEEYMKAERGIDTDIKYSLEVCMTLSMAIIEKCIKNADIKAA